MPHFQEKQMIQVFWFGFQIAVAGLTFWWISTWADVAEYGAAPGIIAMFVAFVASGLLLRLIEAVRASRVGVIDQRKRQTGSAARGRISGGQLPQHPSRLGIGQDRGKIT